MEIKEGLNIFEWMTCFEATIADEDLLNLNEFRF